MTTEFYNAKKIVEENLTKLMELFAMHQILLEDLGADEETINRVQMEAIESIEIFDSMLDRAKTVENLDFINKSICEIGEMLTK